jgi:hypothetical protein
MLIISVRRYVTGVRGFVYSLVVASSVVRRGVVSAGRTDPSLRSGQAPRRTTDDATNSKNAHPPEENPRGWRSETNDLDVVLAVHVVGEWNGILRTG